jgi:hypothetical protein
MTIFSTRIRVAAILIVIALGVGACSRWGLLAKPATVPLDTDLSAFALAGSDVPRGYILEDARLVDNRSLANTFEDPALALEHFERLGRVRSYYAYFANIGSHEMTPPSIASQVIICRDEMSADAYLEYIFDEYRHARVLVDTLGAKSYAWSREADGQDGLIVVEVFFRVDNLVAGVSTAASTPSLEETVALARIMERRISGGQSTRTRLRSGDSGN